MELTGDELAGVVDLFGGLTREELRHALREAAYRAGETIDDEVVAAAIDDAIDGYRLVRYEADDRELLVAGPTAFPTLPAGAEDLPHIVDVEPRTVDRGAVAREVVDRLRTEAETAVEEGDTGRIDRLLDVVYDVEAWGPVDVEDPRTELEAALDAKRDGGG